MVGTAQLYGGCPWLRCKLPWRAVCAHLVAVEGLGVQRLHLADLESAEDLEAVEVLDELAEAVAEALVEQVGAAGHLVEHLCAHEVVAVAVGAHEPLAKKAISALRALDVQGLSRALKA